MIFAVDEMIDAPIDEVWRYLTEPALMTRWMTSIDDIRTADNEPLHEGSKMLFSARGADRMSEVTAFRPNELMTLRSVQGPVTAVYQYALKPNGSGTDARLEATCDADGIFKIFGPLLRYLIRKSDGGQLASLKAAIGESTRST